WRSRTARATSPARSSRSLTPSNTASTSATTLSEHPIAARWRSIRTGGGDAGTARRAALIPYLTAGFPTPQLSLEALRVAAAAGASGLLLTDFPAGADPRVEAVVAASPLALIRLIAPTTTAERLACAVGGGASGFLYLISRLGVTGARDQVPADLPDHVAR